MFFKGGSFSVFNQRVQLCQGVRNKKTKKKNVIESYGSNNFISILEDITVREPLLSVPAC